MQLNRAALLQLPRAVQIEVEENIARKNLSQSELAKVQALLVQVVREHTSRQGERNDLTTCEHRFSPVRDRATARVGAAFNESHKTVENRLAVVAAAEENPPVFGQLLQMLERKGVGPAHKKLRILKRQQAHAARTFQGCTVTNTS